MSEAERRAQARGLLSLFEKWRLTEAEQACLLGHQQDITRLHEGAPLDDTSETLARAANLFVRDRKTCWDGLT